MTDCGCRELLIHMFADLGIEVAASPWQPWMQPTPWEELSMSCPHGIRWHAEPTSDQQAAWVRDGAL